MPVPSLVTDLSTTQASNYPAGSDNVFPSLDDTLRALSAFIASIRDNSGNGWVSPYLPLAGGTVSGPATFSSTVALNGALSGTGLTTYLASPPAIGGTAPAAGSFTSLSASGTVSGTGFSNYLASPPAIGGTAAAAVSSTNLSYTGTLTGGTGIVNLGSGQFYKDASGNVGIGTISPSYRLDAVITASGFPGRFATNSGTAANDAGVLFQTIPSATAATRTAAIYLDANGANASGGDYFYLGMTGSLDAEVTNQAAGPIIFKTTGSERMRLDSSGNLGLGGTPSAWSVYKAFQIGRGALVNASTETDLVHNAFWNGSNWIYVATDFASRHLQINGQHRFFTAPSGTAGNAITFTQAMTLDASGRLLVGRTSSAGSQYSLELDNGSSDNRIGMYAGSTLTGGLLCATNEIRMLGIGASTVLTFQTNGQERSRITSGGDLLVGTTTGGGVGISLFNQANNGNVARIDLNKSASGASTGMSFRHNGTAVGSIVYSNTDTTYVTTSDYRLKDDPQPLTGSGAFIDALQPKTWTWKTEGTRGVGFIAHEAQAVSPSSVVGEKDAVDEDGKPVMQAMEYGSAEFIANIIAELQSLRARVASLEVA